MKKEDVIIIPKTIVLGIFRETNFNYFNKKGAERFAEFLFSANIQSNNIYEIIIQASNWADKIIFVLDGVYFPINPQSSITCFELSIICENDEFFDKTVFVKGENVINFDKNLVIPTS